MEREVDIDKAKGVIKDLLSHYVKRHNRMHKEAAADNVNRLRALEGICGDCPMLKIKFSHKDGKDIVALKCKRGFLPTALYESTPLGSEASCPGFPKKQI